MVLPEDGSARRTGTAPGSRLQARAVAAVEAETRSLVEAIGGELGGLRVRICAPSAGLAVGQVNLVADGHALRAQATARTVDRVPARLAGRMARQVALLSGRYRPRPWPDPLAAHSPTAHGVLEVVTRVKAVELSMLSPLAALLLLDARDYQAHLFRDRDTGQDAVVYRAGPTGYRLARTRAAAPPRPGIHGLVTHPRPAPVYASRAALARVAQLGDPWLFFIDARTGCGALLYARYAGGYGLIEQAD